MDYEENILRYFTLKHHFRVHTCTYSTPCLLIHFSTHSSPITIEVKGMTQSDLTWPDLTLDFLQQPGLLEQLLMATVKRPWLWGVYVFTVGLPIILFVSFMWPDKVGPSWVFVSVMVSWKPILMDFHLDWLSLLLYCKRINLTQKGQSLLVSHERIICTSLLHLIVLYSIV